jgi:hypothetical protein
MKRERGGCNAVSDRCSRFSCGREPLTEPAHVGVPGSHRVTRGGESTGHVRW